MSFTAAGNIPAAGTCFFQLEATPIRQRIPISGTHLAVPNCWPLAAKSAGVSGSRWSTRWGLGFWDLGL